MTNAGMLVQPEAPLGWWVRFPPLAYMSGGRASKARWAGNRLVFPRARGANPCPLAFPTCKQSLQVHMLLSLVLVLTTQAPIVIAPGPARAAVVVLDGVAYSVQTTPLNGAAPEPVPPAPPVPPSPTPVEGVVWVSVIVDASDPKQAMLRTHDAVRGLAKAGAVNLRTYSHDDPALQAVKLSPYVAQHGMPTLVIQDQGGKVLSSGKATDAAGIVAEVKRWKP